MGLFNRGYCYSCGKKFGLTANKWNLERANPMYGMKFVCDTCYFTKGYSRAHDQEFIETLKGISNKIASGGLFEAVKGNNDE